MSNGLGHNGPHNPWNGGHHVADAHEQAGEARGNVQVVDVEACQGTALQPHGHSEQRDGRECGGAKVSAEQEKDSPAEGS